ncbi:MAG: LptF/LptG family permease [Planctomycetota bacterium]|mgnify:CR=1 FL=1
MKILDRYVLRLFLSSYAICLFTLLGIYIIIDFFEKADEFQDYLEVAQQVMGSSKSSQNLFTIYMNYYLCHLPMIFIHIAPAVTLMAAVFTFTRLMKANELIPIKSSGISIYRVMKPIFLCGFLLSFLLIAIQEYVLPALSTNINEVQAIGEHGKWKYLPSLQRFDHRGNVIFIQQYFPYTQEMIDIEISRFLSDYREKEVIAAAKGSLVFENLQSFFLLKEVYFFKYDREARLIKGYPKYEETFRLETSLQSYQMVGSQSHDSVETFSALLEQHHRNPGIPSILVSIHSRITLPLANLIFLTLGLPLVILRETKTFFLGIAVCIIVSAFYFVVNLIFIHLGNKGLLHPVAAAWFPVLFFGALGFVIMNMMET